MQEKKLDETKFYRPKFGDEESKLEISTPQATTNETLNSIAKDGIIEVEIDAKTVKQRIAKDLYSSYQSGFRELFNNEARACRTAIKNYNAKSKILVTINPETKSLIIEGIDSMGVTSEVFKESLRVLGVSGNVSGNEIGQFGFGFASYTTISDMVKFETNARETNEKYTLMGKNGVDFQILDNKDKLDTFGTKLTLTYNDNVSPNEIVYLTRKLARFAGCPVTIDLKEDIESGGYRSSPINAGIYECKTYSNIREYVNEKVLETMKERTSGYGASKKAVKETEDWRITLDIQEEDYEFYGVLIQSKWKEKRQVFIKNTDKKKYITEVRTDCKTHGKGQTLLLGTPIIDGLHITDFTNCVINIKNERKYPPTADRDRLTSDVKTILQPIIEAKIKEKLDGELKITTLDEYKKSKYKTLLTSSRFRDYMPESVTEFRRAAQLGVVTTPNGYGSSIDSLGKLPNEVVYFIKWDTPLVEAIRKHNPKLLVGKVRSYDIELLAKHGAISSQAYKEKYDIKVSRPQSRVKGTAVIWSPVLRKNGTGYYTSKSVQPTTSTVKLEDIEKDKTIMMTAKTRNKYLELLRCFEHNYHLTTTISYVESKAMTDKEFYDKIKDKELEVSWSKKKVKIADMIQSGTYHVGVYSKDVNILSIMSKYGIINKTLKYVICKSYDEYFELAFASRYTGKSSVILDSKPHWTQKGSNIERLGHILTVYRSYNQDYPMESDFRQIELWNEITDKNIMELYSGMSAKARLNEESFESFRKVMAKCAKK